MSGYTESGRKKPTHKTNPEMKRKLQAKGFKVAKGPIFKRKDPVAGSDRGPGYYVQYEGRPGEWMFLGSNKDAAMQAIK